MKMLNKKDSYLMYKALNILKNNIRKNLRVYRKYYFIWNSGRNRYELDFKLISVV